MTYFDVKSTAKLPGAALQGEAIFDKDAKILYVGLGETDPLVALGATGETGPAGPAPTGSGNKVLATPADGSSGVSALRVLVTADLPTGIPKNSCSSGNCNQRGCCRTNCL